MMKTRHMMLMAGVTLLCALGGVLADWDPGDPFKMHFPQLPDLTPNGLDVLAGPIVDATTPATEVFLADDWLCTESGAVTDIHFWGSFLDDQQLMTSLSPGDAFFSLVIYEDIPATPTSFSHPGEPLWDTYIQPTAARLYATADEGFYEPAQGVIVGTDTEVWQFNFSIPAADAFVQTAGEIYWLGIHHTYDVNGDGLVDGGDESSLNAVKPVAFGWKTSQDHFNDDAVWVVVDTLLTFPGHVVPGSGALWGELVYPSMHPFGGQSMDLSFVVDSEPLSDPPAIPTVSEWGLIAMGVLLVGSLGIVLRRPGLGVGAVRGHTLRVLPTAG